MNEVDGEFFEGKRRNMVTMPDGEIPSEPRLRVKSKIKREEPLP